MNTAYKIYPVEAMGKPRMTRSDRITMAKLRARKRLNVREHKRARLLSRWMAYQDECRVRKIEIDMNGFYHLIFVLPMPKSWTLDKKRAMEYTPHQAKPDKDNLEKGLLDTLFGEDMAAWDGQVTKVWGRFGVIIVGTESLQVTAGGIYEMLEIGE